MNKYIISVWQFKNFIIEFPINDMWPNGAQIWLKLLVKTDTRFSTCPLHVWHLRIHHGPDSVLHVLIITAFINLTWIWSQCLHDSISYRENKHFLINPIQNTYKKGIVYQVQIPKIKVLQYLCISNIIYPNTRYKKGKCYSSNVYLVTDVLT